MKRIFLHISFLIIFCYVDSFAQVENFEDETIGSTTFTIGTDVFNTVGDLRVSEYTNFSCTGFTGTNKCMDTGYFNGFSSGIFATISHSNPGLTFTLSTTTPQCGWPGVNDGQLPTTGTLKFIGTKGDNTVISEGFTLTSTDRQDFVPFTFSPAIWGGVALKTLQIEMISGLNYWAMDNLELASIQLLPVDLVSFDGKIVNDFILLNWVTASEINNEGFDVEYSTDGQDWATVGFVEGHQTSVDRHEYSFVPPIEKSKLNYFRLKQRDFDGEFEYSKVINVVFENELVIGLYPNPTKGKITVTGLDEKETTVKIFDSYSTLVKTYQLPEEEINISDLPEGMYFVQINFRNEVVTKRLVKSE